MTEEKEQKSVPFYPDHIGLEAKVALVFGLLVVAVGVIGLFFPLGLEEPADPMDTPAHAKPEWYFLFLYQILKFIPKTIGATAPVIAMLIIAILPFLDRKRETEPRGTKTRWVIAVVTVLLIVALTVWGEVS